MKDVRKEKKFLNDLLQIREGEIDKLTKKVGYYVEQEKRFRYNEKKMEKVQADLQRVRQERDNILKGQDKERRMAPHQKQFLQTLDYLQFDTYQKAIEEKNGEIYDLQQKVATLQQQKQSDSSHKRTRTHLNFYQEGKENRGYVNFLKAHKEGAQLQGERNSSFSTMKKQNSLQMHQSSVDSQRMQRVKSSDKLKKKKGSTGLKEQLCHSQSLAQIGWKRQGQ